MARFASKQPQEGTMATKKSAEAPAEARNDAKGLTMEQLQAQAKATLEALTETGIKADMTEKGQVRVLTPDREVERPFYYRAYKKGLQAVGRPVPTYDEWLRDHLERNGLAK